MQQAIDIMEKEFVDYRERKLKLEMICLVIKGNGKGDLKLLQEKYEKLDEKRKKLLS